MFADVSKMSPSRRFCSSREAVSATYHNDLARAKTKFHFDRMNSVDVVGRSEAVFVSPVTALDALGKQETERKTDRLIEAVEAGAKLEIPWPGTPRENAYRRTTALNHACKVNCLLAFPSSRG